MRLLLRWSRIGVQLYKLEAVFANISSTKGTAHGAWTFFAHC
jgi:hypothetical protein